MRDYKKEADIQKEKYIQHNIKLTKTEDKRLKKILKKYDLLLIEFIRDSIVHYESFGE